MCPVLPSLMLSVLSEEMILGGEPMEPMDRTTERVMGWNIRI
jgi:hypothetical protein